MSEAKHTPGPWHKSVIIVKGANGEAVCFLSQRNDDHRKPDEELEANGNLIAAAPKLLAALERLISNRHCFMTSHEDKDTCAQCGESAATDIEFARAAIAEAKGEL